MQNHDKNIENHWFREINNLSFLINGFCVPHHEKLWKTFDSKRKTVYLSASCVFASQNRKTMKTIDSTCKNIDLLSRTIDFESNIIDLPIRTIDLLSKTVDSLSKTHWVDKQNYCFQTKGTKSFQDSKNKMNLEHVGKSKNNKLVATGDRWVRCHEISFLYSYLRALI